MAGWRDIQTEVLKEIFWHRGDCLCVDITTMRRDRELPIAQQREDVP